MAHGLSFTIPCFGSEDPLKIFSQEHHIIDSGIKGSTLAAVWKIDQGLGKEDGSLRQHTGQEAVTVS